MKQPCHQNQTTINIKLTNVKATSHQNWLTDWLVKARDFEDFASKGKPSPNIWRVTINSVEEIWTYHDFFRQLNWLRCILLLAYALGRWINWIFTARWYKKVNVCRGWELALAAEDGQRETHARYKSYSLNDRQKEASSDGPRQCLHWHHIWQKHATHTYQKEHCRMYDNQYMNNHENEW